jgi:hypothetical protein
MVFRGRDGIWSFCSLRGEGMDDLEILEIENVATLSSNAIYHSLLGCLSW